MYYLVNRQWVYFHPLQTWGLAWVQILAPPFIGWTSNADDNNSGVGDGRGCVSGGEVYLGPKQD